MNTRRTFLQRLFATSALTVAANTVQRANAESLAIPLSPPLPNSHVQGTQPESSSGAPVVLSTWNFGKAANEPAMKILAAGGTALDAVEAGARVAEADLTNTSVGGGYPDKTGVVTVDACIMDERGRCGSVVFVEQIRHVVSVARLVMEKTPHVMLAGEGAVRFALQNGFKRENLLTPNAKAAFAKWKKEQHNKPLAPSNGERPNSEQASGAQHNPHNHDTIGVLALDAHGNLSGACTTSGAAWKMRGRIGDSPIIGAGLFVDNEVGAAAATGLGEIMLRTCASFFIVEQMRLGKSPTQACRAAVERIAAKYPEAKENQAAFIAINRKGEVGAFSTLKGFQYAVFKDGKNVIVDAEHYF